MRWNPKEVDGKAWFQRTETESKAVMVRQSGIGQIPCASQEAHHLRFGGAMGRCYSLPREVLIPDSLKLKEQTT